MSRTRALCLLLIPTILIAFLPSFFHPSNADADDLVARHAVYCVGDSITLGLGCPPVNPPATYTGYPSSLQTLLNTLPREQWAVYNNGVAEDTTTKMLARFETEILDHSDCEYVIVLGGINDILQGVSTATICSNLQQMFTLAHAAGINVVALCITPGDETLVSDIDPVNSWILNTAVDVDYVIDTYTLLEDHANPDHLLPAYSSDGLHPSCAGYAAIAHAIYAALFAVARPSNLAPVDGATSARLTPTLKSSGFSCSYAGETHAASQWQLWKDSSSIIYDSGTDFTNLTITTIDSGRLSHSTTYWWHVRYQGSMGLWSDWSAETSFKTTAKGGSSFWVWIVVVVVVVVVVGAVAYLAANRRVRRVRRVSKPRYRITP
jgi:lysophospholipase L1-like esterase